MPNTLPPSYRTANGCHNCNHVFHRFDYDGGSEYFCDFDAPPRPLCGSSAMDECRPEDVGVNEFWDAWEKWSGCREVDSHGLCDNWEEQSDA